MSMEILQMMVIDIASHMKVVCWKEGHMKMHSNDYNFHLALDNTGSLIHDTNQSPLNQDIKLSFVALSKISELIQYLIRISGIAKSKQKVNLQGTSLSLKFDGRLYS